MLSRSKRFLDWKTGKNMMNVYNHLPCSSFCKITGTPKLDDSPTMTESPELPGWVKFSGEENPLVENPEGDFLIPKLPYWVENSKLQDQISDIKSIVSDITESDVDKVSKILKNRFHSPDEVFETLNGCSVSLSKGLVDQILTRFSNDWIPALGFFNWAKSQVGFEASSDLYTSMVDLLGKCKRFDVMWELVEEISHLEGYVLLPTMTRVMRRLAKAGKYEDAIDAFRKIEQFGGSKDVETLNALMNALVKENSVEHAQNVYLEFRNCIPPNSHTFNTLIHGWCKARQMERAWSALKEMEEHGLRPDAVSYTCFVESYCRDKDFRKVDEILEVMQEKGCAPSAVTYTIVMHALGKAKEINEALKVYEKMKQGSCVPDSSFYSSLIFVLTKAGRLKDAHEVFEDMPKQGVYPDVLTYNTLITAACEHSQEENALKFLREMEKSGCKPDLRTYAPLLKMCCRMKRMKVLSFLLNHMFENDVSLELGSYTLLVRGLCKGGELEHACSFFEKMVSRGFVPMDCTSEMLTKELEKKGMGKLKVRIDELILLAKSSRRM
ncbi:pentatricopeptide repeat-containing protein At3g22670, mitochondrial [Diospyros lotus]|uniref:pentatricopeptide repeat-containing protein At3g22670, mitochondrial n=1 Tax=Diospyros lotus TaxID=55363 RepID=UPI0022505E09|nr:pentatricopeptide repeat-containing protein At3g22670, mitochondrial [Diospyros lotus]